MPGYSVCAWALFTLLQASSSDAVIESLSDCAPAGFNIGKCALSTCDLLDKHFGSSRSRADELNDIVNDCRACCSEILDWTSSKRYDNAVLEVSRSNAGSWGGVNEFLEKRADAYEATGSFRVDDDGSGPSMGGFGAMFGMFTPPAEEPKLSFFDDSEANKLSIRVGSWKIEHIEALLRRKLADAEQVKPASG